MFTDYCPTCGEDREFRPEQKTDTFCVRGEDIELTFPQGVCMTCGEIVNDPDYGDPLERVYATYRQRHGLLAPAEIKRIRVQYNLSHEAFAAVLGMSPATLYRYEAGALQEETHDHLLRMCSGPATMLDVFRHRRAELSELQQKRFLDAFASKPQLQNARLWSEQCELAPEFTGARPFSYFRYALMVKSLLQVHGAAFVTKLNKLVFYADFLAFRCLGQSISGSPYRAIQFGPVPADFGALQDRLLRDNLVRTEEVELGEFGGERLSDGSPIPFPGDVLSDQEMKIIAFVAATLKPMTAREASEMSHREPAWNQTAQKSLISYAHAANLSLNLPTS